MKEIFINQTKYSRKEYNIFIKEHEKQYGLKEDLYTITYAFLFLLFIIYSFINGMFLPGLIIITILVLFLSYRIIHPYVTIKKEFKSKKIRNEELNTYSFYKYYFNVQNTGGKFNILYFKIYKVLETNTHFYIYLNNTNAYVVSKKGFIKGSSVDFSGFLRRRVWLRYKNKKTNS